MIIETTEDGGLVVKEVYSGLLAETQEGNRFGFCMRDDTIEFHVMPKNGKYIWYRVNMQDSTVAKL